MNRKNILIQGIIIIVITMATNIFLANCIFSERISGVIAAQNAIATATDSIFTALTYMEKESTHKYKDKITEELSAAKKSLMNPQLLIIRRGSVD